jgi:hypothetical protein
MTEAVRSGSFGATQTRGLFEERCMFPTGSDSRNLDLIDQGRGPLRDALGRLSRELCEKTSI